MPYRQAAKTLAVKEGRTLVAGQQALPLSYCWPTVLKGSFVTRDGGGSPTGNRNAGGAPVPKRLPRRPHLQGPAVPPLGRGKITSATEGGGGCRPARVEGYSLAGKAVYCLAGTAMYRLVRGGGVLPGRTGRGRVLLERYCSRGGLCGGLQEGQLVRG